MTQKHAARSSLQMHYYKTLLRPDPSRTVIRPFLPSDPKPFEIAGHPRAARIAARVRDMGGRARTEKLREVTDSLDERHRDVDDMLLRRFDDIKDSIDGADALDEGCRKLIGAYLSEEYSFESAALFNPCAVVARDQQGAPEGAVRISLSLRGIGEGHVSSVTFRTGLWYPGGDLVIDKASPTAVAPVIEHRDGDGEDATAFLECSASREVSETVLFPTLPSQSRGIEDLRMTRFEEDDGETHIYATYTAFNGVDARSEMLTGKDFRSFEMRPMTGGAADAKGMALFPKRIGGKYAMLGRQDSESIWLLTSDELLHWDGGAKLISPLYPWEYVQMGNCGPPIEIDEGWLVLTHGVGTVRNYCIGACLLDRHDPSKVLARTEHPILEPSPKERDGYVPNVVYSCGSIVQNRMLLLPYGVADSFTAFCSCKVDDLLAAMR